ncbi:MAG: hypothetical protein A2X12_03660 [Bacteroidetes bacterium GWE2_29_8]|nr:MAG: hypothetical protein A2X12_03660 [Bacteroidetes bacterium GWE2_29_8]
MKRLTRNIIQIILLACFVISFNSCKNKIEEFKVVITVIDLQTQSTVAGAKVKIFKGDILIEKDSDAAGKVSHTFDNEAILDVNATYSDKFGATSVRLIPDEVVEKTVYVN